MLGHLANNCKLSPSAVPSNDGEKLQQHLSLLREQYVRLQEHCTSLEQKLSFASAGKEVVEEQDSFVSRLMKFVSSLYDKIEYSDIVVRMEGKDVKAHRFVLAARGEEWTTESLADVEVLDWRDLSPNIGSSLLQWVYTDNIKLQDYSFVVKLIRAAARFKLTTLIRRCEEALIGWVNIKNCIHLYTTAEEIGAKTLQTHCSTLIALHWDDFTPADFDHMSAPLLYAMFKSKTKFLLHTAVRLQREDVLFLYLIEYDSQLPHLLDGLDSSGRLALDLAFECKHSSIASTLLKHGANIDARDNSGHTLLHQAIKRGDNFACDFILKHGGADVNATNSVQNRMPIHLLCSMKYTNTNVDERMTEVAKTLIDAGADINSQDNLLKTPLHLCIENDKFSIFKVLLNSKNIKLDLKDENDFPPLWFALNAESQNYDSDSFAIMLVKAGADINQTHKSSGNSLIHLVISSGKEKAGLFLCSQKANPSIENCDGETPLHLSCTMGMPLLTKAILQVGGNPNKQTFPKSPEHKRNLNLKSNGYNSINLFNPDDMNLNNLNFYDGNPYGRMNLNEPIKNNPFDDQDVDLFPDEGDNMEGFTVENVFRETALHRAIRKNNDGDVEAILEFKKNFQSNSNLENPQLDLENSLGLTPLGVALNDANYKIAHMLIESGASVNQLDPEGYSLLHRAINNNQVKTALFLLNHEADPNLRTFDANSPLDLCIEHSLLEVCEELCSKGVDLNSDENITDVSEPILWRALNHGKLDIAHILVRHNVDVEGYSETSDGSLQTMLHRAIDENQEEIACFLIRSGCSVNAVKKPHTSGNYDSASDIDQQTSLHMCCEWGLLETAKELICHGAKINAKDIEGKTPFHLALESGHEDISKLLLLQPALDLGCKDKKGRTPFAVAMLRRSNKAAQDILNKLPSAAEQYDRKGLNFLHSAIQRDDLENILFLISIHVNLTSRTKDDRSLTPLHLATLKGNEMVVRNLILAGADINELTPQKQTCLHLCAATDQSSMAVIFMQNKINIDALDDNLNNALHVAVKEGHLGIVRTLLTESCINAGCINLRGQNALHVLASYPKDNAAAIANAFLEAMPKYPINLGDVEGNTALLLAYMKGSGQLCRVLVSAEASLGQPNISGVHLFNYQVATRTLLARLLDAVAVEPPWSEGEYCLECGNKFGIATRKHHCRHCGRLLCAKCSAKEVPILKFGINKPVRVCQMCFDVLTLGPSSVL